MIIDFPFGHRFVVFAVAARLAAVLVAQLHRVSRREGDVVPDHHLYIGLNQSGPHQNLPANIGRLRERLRHCVAAQAEAANVNRADCLRFGDVAVLCNAHRSPRR